MYKIRSCKRGIFASNDIYIIHIYIYIYIHKSPDEWATTKQVCRDELVVYLSFSSHNIYIYIYIFFFHLHQFVNHRLWFKSVQPG